MVKKTFCAFLLFVIMLSALCGCKNEKKDSQTDVSSNLNSAQIKESDASQEASQNAKANKTTKAFVNDEKINKFGRIEKKDKICNFFWTDSGFEVSFKGTGLEVMLGTTETSNDWKPYVQIYVDGKKTERIAVLKNSKQTLCENLSYGEHTVKVVKTTEISSSPLMASYVNIISSAGEPELLDAVKKGGLNFEFIGDSITCGFGNLGQSSEKYFSTEKQDGTQTYSYLTSEHFNATSDYISVSGKGIVKNVGGDKNQLVPDYYLLNHLNSKENWDFNSFKTDVVVINLGTNDGNGGASSSEFKNGAVDFLKLVRKNNTNAKIVWCYGLMGTHFENEIKDAISTIGDKNMHYLHFDPISSKNREIGSVGHPNVKAHERAARTLVDFLTDIGVKSH